MITGRTKEADPLSGKTKREIQSYECRHYSYGGFFFIGGREPLEDPEDLVDLKDTRWTREEFQSDLNHEIFPTGAIIKRRGALPLVIVRDPEGNQTAIGIIDFVRGMINE